MHYAQSGLTGVGEQRARAALATTAELAVVVNE